MNACDGCTIASSYSIHKVFMAILREDQRVPIGVGLTKSPLSHTVILIPNTTRQKVVPACNCRPFSPPRPSFPVLPNLCSQAMTKRRARWRASSFRKAPVAAAECGCASGGDTCAARGSAACVRHATSAPRVAISSSSRYMHAYVPLTPKEKG